MSSYDYVTQVLTPVAVTAGGAFTVENIELVRRPVISGTLSDTEGAPATNVVVCAEGDAGRFCDYSTPTGNYSFSVPPGDFIVEAPDSYYGFQNRYRTQFYPGLTERPAVPNVVVEADVVADFELVARPQIVGAVTVEGASTCGVGSTSRYIQVTAIASDSTEFLASAYCPSGASADASFSIVVEPGTYTLRFGQTWAGDPFVQEYWDDALDPANATPIVVVDGDVAVANADLALKPVIQGTVTSNAVGSPVVPSGYVYALDSLGEYVTSSPIVNGVYEIPVSEGVYRLRFTATGFATEYWDDQLSFENADSLVVGPSGVTANAELEALASISGTITSDDPAVPLSGWVYVNAYDLAGNYAGSGSTYISGLSGGYQVYLRPGTYRLEFSSSGFVTEWWDDQPSRSDVQPRSSLDSGGAVADASLAPKLLRTIRGTVVGDDVALGIQGVGVRALFGSGAWAGSTTTGPAGDFELRVEPGEYIIEFEATSIGFVREFFEDRPDFATATVVDVRSSDQVVNASLATGGSISGSLLSAGNPVGGCVIAVDAADQTKTVGSACTSPTGSYTINGLPEGNYRLYGYAYNDGQVLWYGGSSFSTATEVGAVAGVDTANIDFDLAVVPGETISGYVLDSEGQPIQDVRVIANGPVYRSTSTDELGYYELVGLGSSPTYGYRVSFEKPGYVSEYYDDALSYSSAADLIVDGASLTLGDVVLDIAEANLSGTVVEEISGDPAPGVCVDFYEANRFSYRTCTDDVGNYSIELPLGSFQVQLDDGNYPRRYISEVEYPSAAPLVTVAGLNSIDMNIVRGSQISGRVTQEGTSTGIPSIRIEVLDSSGWQVAYGWTDGSGFYTTDAVINGDYSVRFSNSSGRYITEYFDDSVLAPGTLVAVAGADVTDIERGAVSRGSRFGDHHGCRVRVAYRGRLCLSVAPR